MRKNYRKILLFIFLIVVFVFTIVPVVLLYKTPDEYADFIKHKNKIQISSSYIIARDLQYRDNDNVIIIPTRYVDNISYILLADKISDNGYNTYISSYLFNSMDFLSNKSYKNIYDSFITQHKNFYIVVHGDLLYSGKEFILEHLSNVKGIIFLDGYSKELVEQNIRTLCIYSDDYVLNKDNYPFNTEYYYIKGGSFDGYANYIDKELNELPWERQQNLVVNKIMEFINEDK